MAGKNDNLIPQNERTKEEQRAIARMGGIASGKARRKKKTMREAMAALLDAEIAKGVETNLKKRGYKGKMPETNNEALQISMFLEAMMAGNPKAYGAIMTLMGENVQQVEISSSDEKFAEVLDIWEDKRSDAE